MDIQQFLEELKDIDFSALDREQQEEFRTILLDNGLFDECLELSRIIYEQNREDDTAIEGYVHNLLYLDKKDDAFSSIIQFTKNTFNFISRRIDIFRR